MKIIENKARCRLCRELVVSEPAEGSVKKFCQCGAIAVYGGDKYIQRLGNHRHIDELSIKEY